MCYTGATMSNVVTKFQVCELCEASCGLAVDVDDGRAVAIRGNDRDVFSRGFICPKGIATLALQDDPDRLRAPMKRTAPGRFEPISWDEALDLAAHGLSAAQKAHGRDAVAVYLGTPIVHKAEALLMRSAILGALGTKNSTSAGSQDTAARFAASYYLYGSSFSWPIPDVDRTDFFLCIGANPLVSNGSLLTAPNVRGRLKAILDRGGKVVVVDPRRTETARFASEHLAIIPGTDAAFVMALVNALLEDGLIDEARLEKATTGWSIIREQVATWTPERVAAYTGIDAEKTRRIAREFASAKTACAYSRVGVCNTAFGTLASYAVDLLNIVTGRLGAEGGAMFASPPIDVPLLARLTKSDGHGRWRTRVRGLPETSGDVPASTLAEEMETPGPGQVRAFLTIAGNPVLSTPNGTRLAKALEQLEFMVSIDYYINETTRFASVILPPCGPLSDGHVDLFFANAMAHNAIRWTEPAIVRGPDERADWEILLELAFRLGGGPTGMPALDAFYRLGRRLGMKYHPNTLFDLAVRTGQHGDHFLPWREGLSASKIQARPDGIDLGPLRPGSSRRVYHDDGKIHLAPKLIVAAFDELGADVARERSPNDLRLIGRRDIRSNNSWMHNLPKLVSGKDRCVLYVHPDDAQRLGLRNGGTAVMESRVHRAEVPVEITDDVRPGVVSLPHGHGHAPSRPYQSVSAQRPGVSANDWTDDQAVESIVGQSILNGVDVRLSAASSETRAAE
jgi:anaerobic selenocysteine-containing dehydrogenase